MLPREGRRPLSVGVADAPVRDSLRLCTGLGEGQTARAEYVEAVDCYSTATSSLGSTSPAIAAVGVLPAGSLRWLADDEERSARATRSYSSAISSRWRLEASCVHGVRAPRSPPR